MDPSAKTCFCKKKASALLTTTKTHILRLDQSSWKRFSTKCSVCSKDPKRNQNSDHALHPLFLGFSFQWTWLSRRLNALEPVSASAVDGAFVAERQDYFCDRCKTTGPSVFFGMVHVEGGVHPLCRNVFDDAWYTWTWQALGRCPHSLAVTLFLLSWLTSTCLDRSGQAWEDTKSQDTEDTLYIKIHLVRAEVVAMLRRDSFSPAIIFDALAFPKHGNKKTMAFVT